MSGTSWPLPEPSWTWKFINSGWSLHAWLGTEGNDRVVKVQWRNKDGGWVAQSLWIYPDDAGSECLESLAKFVAMIQKNPDAGRPPPATQESSD